MNRPKAAIPTILALTLLALALFPPPSRAFMDNGCGSGKCVDCHSLSVDEAARLVKPLDIERVTEVHESPIKGLWAVEAEKGGAKGTIFIDYGKKHVLQAQIIRLDTKENVTSARKIDPSKIPLATALLIGRPEATKKIIVFSDPDCHFCAKLHEAIKAVVAKEPDVAFQLLLFSRNNDPGAIRKAQAVLCTKSLPMLDNAYLGKYVPAPECATDAVAENARIAASVGVNATPVLVMPDGRMIPGFRDADAILRLLKEEAPPVGISK